MHPRCATGTLPAAAASTTCSSPCLWEGVWFPFSTRLASARGQQGQPEHCPRSLCLLQCQARLGRFLLETRRSIYQWGLETSERGEVKLALNELIKSGERETSLKACLGKGRHLLVSVPPGLPVLPPALTE